MPKEIKKVLVKTKFFRDGSYAGFWRADYEGKVIAETETCVLVRTGIFKKEWLPKNGMYIKIEDIKSLCQENKR